MEKSSPAVSEARCRLRTKAIQWVYCELMRAQMDKKTRYALTLAEINPLLNEYEHCRRLDGEELNFPQEVRSWLISTCLVDVTDFFGLSRCALMTIAIVKARAHIEFRWDSEHSRKPWQIELPSFSELNQFN
jgi:hypothetical protein